MELFIYTLTDPTSKEIRYIGKTKNIKNRLMRHMSSSNLKETWTSKNKWLKYLKNNKLMPIIEILDEGDESNINILEIYWISQFKTWGFKLTNETNGGDGNSKYWTGAKHKKESVEKMKMNHPFRKTICQYNIETDELIAEFNSSHEAQSILKLSRNAICKCCKGKKSYNSVGGFYFRFKDNYFPFVRVNSSIGILKKRYKINISI